MMARQPLTPSQKRFRRRGTIVSFVAAALLIAGFVAMKPLLPDGPRRIDDILVTIAGAVVLQMGLILTIAHSVIPKHAPMPRHQRLAQVLSCLIGGVTLLLPIFGERFIDPQLNFAIILVLTGISFWATWLIWRGADELTRELIKDTYAASYFVTATALWIYAVGERLGLLNGVTAWGAIGFATLVGIICSVWAAYRRGLDRPPADE